MTFFMKFVIGLLSAEIIRHAKNIPRSKRTGKNLRRKKYPSHSTPPGCSSCVSTLARMTSALWRLTRFNVSFEERACLDRIVEKASDQVRQDLDDFGLAALAPSEVFRRISQNFSPAGVTSPFVARVIPTDIISVVPVIGR